MNYFIRKDNLCLDPLNNNEIKYFNVFFPATVLNEILTFFSSLVEKKNPLVALVCNPHTRVNCPFLLNN